MCQYMIVVFLLLTYFTLTDTRFIHITRNDPISFLFMAEEYSIVYMYHIFIHSSVNGYLGCFHILAIVNKCCTEPEEAMAPHSSTLVWKIPWMEEPGGLQSTGSQGVGYD